jgi:hypothetical protein
LRLLHHLKRMMCRYHKVSRYDRTLKKWRNKGEKECEGMISKISKTTSKVQRA